MKQLNETNLNRLTRGHNKDGYIIISPCRGSQDFPNMNDQQVVDENNKRIRKMKNYLRNKGYSYIQVYGGYKEEGSEESSFETSFVVFPFDLSTKKEREFDDLYNDMLNLADDFNQDTILVARPNDNPKYVDRNGNVEMEFSGKLSFNDLSKEYFTALKKNEKSKRFTFESIYYKPCGNIMDGHMRTCLNEFVNPNMDQEDKMKKKKQIIPGNPGDGIALFNQALGNGTMTEDYMGLVADLRRNYTDDEIEEACQALRAEYNSDTDMLMEFKEKVDPEYVDWMNYVYNGQLDSEVVDDILWDICFTLDPRFIKNFLNGQDDLTESFYIDFEDDGWEYEIDEDMMEEFLDHKYPDKRDLVIECLTYFKLKEDDIDFLNQDLEMPLQLNETFLRNLDDYNFEILTDNFLDLFNYETIIDKLDIVDELKDYFEHEAYEAHEDYKFYKRDPYGYYGLNRSDFY